MNSTLLSDLATELLTIPETIANLQLETLLLNEKQQLLKAEITVAEMKMKAKIADAVDENGKKLYSNADAREAAFVQEKEADLELHGMHKEEQKVHLDLQKKKIEYERACNTQRNVRSILSFFSANPGIEGADLD
jgi:hypothetical protein